MRYFHSAVRTTDVVLLEEHTSPGHNFTVSKERIFKLLELDVKTPEATMCPGDQRELASFRRWLVGNYRSSNFSSTFFMSNLNTGKVLLFQWSGENEALVQRAVAYMSERT